MYQVLDKQHSTAELATEALRRTPRGTTLTRPDGAVAAVSLGQGRVRWLIAFDCPAHGGRA